MYTPKAHYKEVSLIKKQHKKKSKKTLFFVITCIFLLIFVIFCIFYFLNFLHTDKLNSQKFYALYTPLNAETNQSAENLASLYKARGGAGVFIKIDDAFGAILSICLNKDDALSVQENLSKQNITCQILQLSTPQLKIAKLEESYKKITKNIYQKYLDTICLLYEISTSLDKNDLTESQAIIRINELALLWENRTNELSQEIDINLNTNSTSTSHPLYPIYSLCLSVTGQLRYLANENTYQNSLKTFVSVIRQINYTLICVNI